MRSASRDLVVLGYPAAAASAGVRLLSHCLTICVSLRLARTRALVSVCLGLCDDSSPVLCSTEYSLLVALPKHSHVTSFVCVGTDDALPPAKDENMDHVFTQTFIETIESQSDCLKAFSWICSVFRISLVPFSSMARHQLTDIQTDIRTIQTGFNEAGSSLAHVRPPLFRLLPHARSLLQPPAQGRHSHCLWK